MPKPIKRVKIGGYKTSIQKLITFIYTNNNQLEHILEEQTLFIIVNKRKRKKKKEVEQEIWKIQMRKALKHSPNKTTKLDWNR